MEWLPALVALTIALAFPILDRGRMAGLRDKPTEAGRLRLYRRSFVALWCAAAAALSVDSGWRPMQVLPSFGETWRHVWAPWLGGVVGVICAGFLAIAVQGLVAGSSAARRKAIEPAFARLAFLLPVSRRERRWWIALSLSAGICEELLYRGYLFHFLDAHVGLVIAWLLSSLAFGFAHLYQGWRGIASTTVTGLVFGLLALGTGSLALPIVVHVLVDLQVLWMYRPTDQRS